MPRWTNAAAVTLLMLSLPVAAIALLMLSLPVAAGGATAPTLTGTALGGGPLGETPLRDRVRLSGTAAGTGTITFSLFGPENQTCEGSPIESSTAVVHGDQEYLSSEYFPSQTGTYSYLASYSGDAENGPAATACGAPGQSVTVTRATPSLATAASSSVSVGGGISDTARLIGGYSPTGSITFKLYPPGDTTCSLSPIATFFTPIGEEARFKSSSYTALAEGQYLWVASYSGDSRNLPAEGKCGEAGESVLVTQLGLPAALHVRASAVAGEAPEMTATASLRGTGGAGGALTFLVYGPNDPQCQHGALTAFTRPVPGDGEYASDPFDLPEPGTYGFILTYDGTNGVKAETACGEPGSEAEVRGAEPPVLDKSITVARVSGTVLVSVHAAAATRGASASSVGFVEVRGPRSVPVGSTIDTKAGTAKLTAATVEKQFQSGVFAGSRFVLHQRAGNRGVVELDLRPSVAARRSCVLTSRRARAALRRKPPPKLLARLEAEVKGQFRTTGRYSSASAHGTSWQMSERCDGTLTRVLSDIVTVRDFHRHRSVSVHAGHSYLARASG
jgi:hypothetical protein